MNTIKIPVKPSLFFNPEGHRCKCGEPAIGFHPYVGYACKIHITLAQEQFCRVGNICKDAVDYEI